MIMSKPIRWPALAVASLTGSALALTVAVPAPPRLVWNLTESAPTGLYRISDARGLRRGDLVVLVPPETLRSWLDSRRYLDTGALLLKPVEALPGSRVCRSDGGITVNGEWRAHARARDRQGRSLPRWRGCHIVARDELFLLNAEHSGSLDGRYFGAVPRSNVLGRAIPLWTTGIPR